MKKAVLHLSNADEKLQFIFANFGLPIIQKRTEGFASMCHIILEQQVSIASAKASYDKLERFLIQITPLQILQISEQEIRNCGISRQKTVYLKDLAAKVASKHIDFLSFKNKTKAQIRAELITIKGVGNWSIDVYLMFCLQLQDIIPLGDIAIKNTMFELYQTQTLAEMRAVSDRWKPYRTYACYALWHYYLKKRGRV